MKTKLVVYKKRLVVHDDLHLEKIQGNDYFDVDYGDCIRLLSVWLFTESCYLKMIQASTDMWIISETPKMNLLAIFAIMYISVI